ncbi:conserved Plasmodium protein, unknown function [Plasmodium chabaudi chabaudi]|uniref:BAP29/BAP31 transmembrane domain-containing protein n=2 Tax=Plasmodium chabaudi TaxID=5825 RepID=A0A077TVS7_PLACU|nr:conserved protein, unknown function [Plasmodium chabaudi chabaudi]SCM25777.1 conserved Plasmodium protein, unknown function [Plasmodium chabaudi adami]SCM26960.1 conserved Plasmodium protein, unknown function [Plasmodium chabaudi chabaudi]SCN63702.1 conserved Plasmodium protein, unknown function [Plasmodium chabaudi chabaudi]SCN63703.1 conserved Plasmodium protein, unknown function [Plasmodium chabaudi adami]VTZ71311.1 conserved protein, unknown function [Plasmodium chabaudi chabaudi]|eukprot:XP_741988.1 conserved Plasmodium protein, unknown function [Plasmodium chabaudi chabaudi]
MSLVKLIYLIVTPLGITLLISCLLKIKFLVNFSFTFCRKQIGDTPIRVVSLILILNFMLFITESYKLKYGLKHVYNHNDPISGVSPDHLKIYKWRHERNWWIGLSNFCIWLILWRFTGIINNYVIYMDQLKKKLSQMSTI